LLNLVYFQRLRRSAPERTVAFNVALGADIFYLFFSFLADCTYVTVERMVRVVVCLFVCLSICLSVCYGCIVANI